MTDPTSDDGRDDFILQERLAGRSARSISKQLRCTVGEVDASLDRTLPKIDNDARRRYVALDLSRLDELLKVFFARAIENVDAQAGLLVVKILERRALLLGLDSPGIAIAGLVLGWLCYSIASNLLTYLHTAPEVRH